MKSASLKQIRTELSSYSDDKLEALILRLAKYKKDNKELLTYLLFEADNEDGYIEAVKLQIDADYKNLNKVSLFLAKKTIRKALRTTDKFIRYSGLKQTEASLRIYFCYRMKAYRILWKYSPAMENLYNRQLEKIDKAISYLHEDLQFDFKMEVEELLGVIDNS